MIKKYLKYSSTVFLVFLLTSCDAYIEFERARFKFIIYIFIGTFVLGVIGFFFDGKK